MHSLPAWLSTHTPGMPLGAGIRAMIGGAGYWRAEPISACFGISTFTDKTASSTIKQKYRETAELRRATILIYTKVLMRLLHHRTYGYKAAFSVSPMHSFSYLFQLRGQQCEDFQNTRFTSSSVIVADTGFSYRYFGSASRPQVFHALLYYARFSISLLSLARLLYFVGVLS